MAGGLWSVLLGADGLPALRHYIANQERHHAAVDFRSEFLALCKAAGIEVDERFLD